MSKAIVPATPLDLDRVKRLAERPRAKTTTRAYASDWASWTAFCEAHRVPPLPASEGAIVAFLGHLQAVGHVHSTITRHYASIRAKHLDAGHPLPTLEAVRNALKNIAREIGTAPDAKTPLTADRLKQIARQYDEDAGNEKLSRYRRVLAVRDAALLLVGFGAARRPNEVVALDVEEVEFVEDGLLLRVERSKTDQAGEGLAVGIAFGSSRATCPARALKRWLELTGLTEGPLFRGVDRAGCVLAERLSTEGVSRAVKRAVARLGLDRADYGGHSLRSGFATSAAVAGKPLHAIMRQGGWQSERTVRVRYIRPATVFQDNASEGLL